MDPSPCFVYVPSAEVIIAGGQIFKIAASPLVDVSEEEINLMKENAGQNNKRIVSASTILKCFMQIC